MRKVALGHHEEWGRLLRISAQAERDWTLGIGPVFRQPGWGPLCPCSELMGQASRRPEWPSMGAAF